MSTERISCGACCPGGSGQRASASSRERRGARSRSSAGCGSTSRRACQTASGQTPAESAPTAAAGRRSRATLGVAGEVRGPPPRADLCAMSWGEFARLSAATSVRVSDDLVGWVKRCDGGVKEEERRRPFLSEETVEVRSSGRRTALWDAQAGGAFALGGF